MLVKELIAALFYLPQDAVVGYIYDGALRGDVRHVWLTKDGRVALVDYDETVYGDDDRPLDAPSKAEDPYWSSGVNPQSDED